MFDNCLKNIVEFNVLNKKARISYICDKLKINGVIPEVQTFSSCFGEGINIFAKIGNSSKKYIVLSAHYDGDSLFDNAGGVITLLNIADLLSNQKSKFPIVLLFTDQEETYQQGAAYFIKYFQKTNILRHINLDGFGLGDELHFITEMNKNIFDKKELLISDSNEFIKNGISSTSYFTSFEIDFSNIRNNGNVYMHFNKYLSINYFINNFNNCEFIKNFKNISNIILSILQTT